VRQADDPPGRTTRLTRDEHGRVVAADGADRRRFDYDPAGQLVRETGPGGERGFTYAAAGRLAAENGPDGEREYHYDAAGQLTSSTGPDGPRHYRYDAAGRRTAEEGPHDRRSYRWDPFGPLTGIDSTTLQVDALGELVQAGDVPLAWDTADPRPRPSPSATGP